MHHSSNDVCQVHLWKYRLQQAIPDLSMAWFSPEEKFKLVRLRHYTDRKQYIQVHGFLKKILEQYIHLPPDQIHFIDGANGKPFLKSENAHPPLYFNLSYRHEYALLALSNEPCIGVDVEEVKPLENFFPFMTTHFTKHERERILEEKTQAKQTSLLFTFWAMKEALIKSLGEGFSRSIKKYEVLPFLKKPLGYPDSDLSAQWCMEQIPVAKNYKAAMALKAKKADVKIFEYTSVNEMATYVVK